MINYSISYSNPLTHLIEVEICIDNNEGSFLEINLPAWRPGRYELQNYAANIKQFKAFDENAHSLNYNKKSRNCWRIETGNTQKIRVHYKYFAYQMDAGGCWLDEEQLYLNFICCLMFIPKRINESCSVQLSLPANYQIACGLPKEQHLLKAENFYHLVDCPMIASATLKHFSFDCQGVPFYIWIQGTNYLSSDQMVSDFKKYTEEQISMMGNFPEKEYHYLFQFLPYKHYHGVEHRNSTVITLGSSEEIPHKGYSDLVGISSHELFHAWNIVKIRPTEMLPYDFTKENYFTTGFVAEGFTTYYGDLFLVRSGVISKEDYFSELNTTLKRHFDNFGNTNLSLAESSQDLWVDGYVAGIPNRKVSIYVKGCVVALLLDLEIRSKTENKKSLDDLMRLLWEEFGKKNVGYSFQDIKNATDKIARVDTKDFFEECVFGHTDLKERLKQSLKTVGCLLQEKFSANVSETSYGVKFLNKSNRIYVDAIAPGSPAENTFCKDDELLSINGTEIIGDINYTLSSSEMINFVVNRWGRKVAVTLEKNNLEKFFPEYTIVQNDKAEGSEKLSGKKWLYEEL